MFSEIFQTMQNENGELGESKEIVVDDEKSEEPSRTIDVLTPHLTKRKLYHVQDSTP